MRFSWAILLLFAACDDGNSASDASVPSLDAGGSDQSLYSEGGVPLRGAFTISGCSSLVVDSDGPLCTGSAPLSLEFLPLAATASTFAWTFEGGDPSTSASASPAVTYLLPSATGIPFAVGFVAGGGSGSVRAVGRVLVTPAVVGAACSSSPQCGEGFECICGADSDGGACTGTFAAGLCSRSCQGGGCGSGSCVDLSRGGGGDPWRAALCLPTCVSDGDCRPGLRCRDVPVLDPLQNAGGQFHWRKACFSDALGDDGAPCVDVGGAPSAQSCLSGRCDPLGARGLCTSDCAHCVDGTTCAVFNTDMGISRCLRTCGGTFSCAADPLLDCEAAGQSGGQAFTVSPDLGAQIRYCAPKRCTQASDCAPSGICVSNYCVKV